MLRRVMSPCIGICKLDQKSGLCIGCKRTIDEIGRWAMLADPERQAIIDQLDASSNAIGSDSAIDFGVKSTFLTWVSGLMNNDVDWNGNIWGLVTPNAWLQMETIDDFVSIDYNAVKPLVEGAPPLGQFREWLGVKWLRHTGLTGKGGAAAKCYIYSGDAIGHQIDGEPMTHMYYEDEEDRYGTWVKTIHCAKLVLTRGVYRAVHDDTAAIA